MHVQLWIAHWHGLGYTFFVLQSAFHHLEMVQVAKEDLDKLNHLECDVGHINLDQLQ